VIQITAHMRIFVARHAVDFRKGIDGLSAVCRQVLMQNPLEGGVFVFRARSRIAVRILVYDGQGMWLMTKRL
jgi:transposase